MPGRKKPASAKQHKAKLQHQRAVKRGDAEPDPPKDHRPRKPSARARTVRPQDPSTTASGSALSTPEHLKAQQIIASARRLQSSFVKLSPALLERSKVLADRVYLVRPIPYDAAVWKLTSGRMEDEKEEAIRKEMSCMRRPKWKYEQTKKEVEKNEEGVYAKWLDKMDGLVQSWVDAADEARRSGLELAKDRDPELPPKEDEGMPPSPTIFERNLEVWRQLWRVTELSQILLILLDSRCPLLHFPPSLQTYLSSPSYKLILVLTKVDISGPERAEAWSAYLTAKFPGVQVVMVESYIPKATVADFDNGGEVNLTKRGRRRYEPHIPYTFKERLVDALKTAHRQLLEPPERVRQDPEKLAKWRPKVKREVNWDALLTAGASSHAHVSRPTKDAPQNSEGGQEDEEPEYLTVGLLGQPNVGKSSLLNALFGTIKVRASKTPGKTKHFQTLFWTPDIRLVDCPGLVMPDLIPLEMQVLSGILPIARMPAIPLCISYSARLLPLEQIFNLASHHPFVKSPPAQDKRTWRQGMRKGSVTDCGAGDGGDAGGMEDGKEKKEPKWTAMDIMTAYADRKGWVTAKAGRPDVNRAGNAMLRALAEGKIPWAFWPPGTDPATLSQSTKPAHVGVGVGAGNGIWIPDPTGEEHEIDEESEDEEPEGVDSDSDGEDVVGSVESGDGEDEKDEEEEPVIAVAKKGGGMFGALALDDDAEEEEEEEKEEENEEV